MGVKVTRHPDGVIKSDDMTQYTLIYHEALDQPTKACELVWRAFETRFFRECCQEINPTRLESDVFRIRAEIEQLPNSKKWLHKVGQRFTFVLISDYELSWLVENGSSMLRVIEEDFVVHGALLDEGNARDNW